MGLLTTWVRCELIGSHGSVTTERGVIGILVPLMFSPLNLWLFWSFLWAGVGSIPLCWNTHQNTNQILAPILCPWKGDSQQSKRRRGMPFASPPGSLGFCKCTLCLAVSLECYLSILLTAAVNRAGAALHRWWEGRLHNSSCPITLLPFSLLYLITEAQINTLGQKRNEFSS